MDSFEGSFEAILPLVKFFIKHENQLSSLCENIGHSNIFLNFHSSLNQKNIHLISDFVDKLTNDHSRFVPEDGNVDNLLD